MGSTREEENEMSRKYILLALCLSAAFAMADAAEPSDDLRSAFAHPPDSARPWVYWFWLNGNITREGITADLEAMKRAGIGGVLIMEVDQGIPAGPVDFMGGEWRALFHHVLSEAARLGLEVNMNNDAGWNGSGGPWIKPEESMQKVVFSETTVEGPKRFEGPLPLPETVAGYYRDIAVQAFPAPGSFRIENIQVKACYQTGFIMPGPIGETPDGAAINPASLIDLTDKMDTDGRIAWDVPAGPWTILRIGHTSTGVENAPSPKTGRGLECDKLAPEGIEAQFDGMMKKLIADAGPLAGKALVATHIDSWENGAQNWTARMREAFRERRGYDLLPFLPVFSGRVVGSLEQSERFLWDLRQTVSDLVVENYAGRLRELARKHGMRLTIEAYGGPCDDMPYAGRADEPMSEFWIGGGALGACKEMASAAHTWGRIIHGAESFTADDSERWQQHPATMKPLGDLAFCLGVNRFVFHRYALQPWRDRRPGMTMGPWGVHYERTQTWWEMAPAWHEYLARCQHMLRQGLFVADICYLQPEAAPQGYQEHHRNGYDFDNIGADALIERMSVKEGRLMLPDGMSYRLLVLPDVRVMTPRLLRKIGELVEAGATVAGPKPLKSPSLMDYPKCDEEVKRMADAIWGDCDGGTVKEHAFGKGRVIWGIMPEEILRQSGVKPDFGSWVRLNSIHRATDDTDIYFVANPKPHAVAATCSFRVQGKRPELWWPETGRIEPAALWAEKDGLTNVTLPLEPSGSVFVMFREKAEGDPAVAVARNGETLQSALEAAPKITVTRAVYGVPGDPQRSRDARDGVQKLVDAGESHFKVSRLAEEGDPAFGTLKTLEVEYTANGRTFTAKGNDPDVVHLTADSTRIIVDKAIYGVIGDAARTRDVREKLQHLLDTGESSFLVAAMAQGDDPAVNVVKTLLLEYTIDGKRYSTSGNDGTTLVLYEPPGAGRTVNVQCGADGATTLEAFQPGSYEVRTASGKTFRADVADPPEPFDLSANWVVRFPPNWGAPEQVALDVLASLSEHPDPGVRYFSGVATYTKTFDAPEALPGANRRIYLDLGNVQVMAQVRLNGEDLGILWKPPFRLDVTDRLKPSGNLLEVSVANLWINRMIGDEQRPEDSDRHPEGTLKAWPQWLGEDQPSPTGRFTFTTWRLWKKDAPLRESGLIGPVALQAAEVVSLNS